MFSTNSNALFFPACRLNHIGLFLNGMAGPVAMAVGPLISAVWFPPGQRTTSTAATALSGYYGLAFSFVIGPVFVPSYKKFNVTSNCTDLVHKYSTNRWQNYSVVILLLL